MNILNILPAKIRKAYIKNITLSGIEIPPHEYFANIISKSFIFSLILAIGLFFLKLNLFLSFFGCFVFLNLFFYFRISLKASARIKKMERIFPDVIQLMSSNLRAGMTIDKAFLVSARPEFFPLNNEMLKAGKDIATGEDIATAFNSMAKRIGSDKINKTVMLIISGIKAGGNISMLLEQTATNMREKEFLEKRVSSSVLMYVIFIFFAVGIGAPMLFALSSVLVEILTKIMGEIQLESISNLPFTLTRVAVSIGFIKYFSIVFIITTDILASLVIGIVNKGEEKAGLKFLLPLIFLSLSVYFVIRFILYRVIVKSVSLTT